MKMYRKLWAGFGQGFYSLAKTEYHEMQMIQLSDSSAHDSVFLDSHLKPALYNVNSTVNANNLKF